MAGYTTITVKGQEIGLRFGLRAIKRISEKLKEIIGNKELDEDDKSILILRDRIYSAYLCDCMYRDIQPSIPVQDFTEYVENAAIAKNMQELIVVYKVYQESIAALPKVEDPGDEKKNLNLKTKKLTGTKPKSSVKEETGILTGSPGVSLSFSEEPMIGNGLNN
jgi:hypothetical protein